MYLGIARGFAALSVALVVCAHALASPIALTAPGFLVGAVEANGELAFPARDAGIAAYVRLGQTFELADVQPVFNEMVAVGDNYMIGIIKIQNFGDPSPVHLYVDADGWMIAYIKRNESTAAIMQWLPADKNTPQISTIPRTTLLDAMKLAADAIGVGSIPQAKYYHFRYTNASHLTIFVKTIAEEGDAHTQVQIPGDYSLFEASYSHFYITDNSRKNNWAGTWYIRSKVMVDGTTVSELVGDYGTIPEWMTAVNSYQEAIGIGKLHKIEVTYSLERDPNWKPAELGSAGVATAIVYGPKLE